MCRAFLILLGLCGVVAGASAVETLRPEQLHRGMKGYGLSVFQGTEPQRFEVEILGVLPNVFPKQDMILIRMSGANLEQHKVIAGMSGSPIYVDDKLIGALAYGWEFENEPLAGVTPIHNMLAELNQPVGDKPGTVTIRSSLENAAPLDSEISPFGSPAAYAAPQPLLTPLSVGGFSPLVLETFGGTWQRLGLLPVAAGGGASGAKLPRGTIVPGGAIGVELIRGDLSAVAVGTAAYVAGKRILAFGHPFFQSGQWRAPAVLADVQTIMSSALRSFKMATARARIGSLIGDWQSCIVADTAVDAPMIPVAIDTSNRETGQQQTYHVEVVDNQKLSPALVQMAIVEAITAASGSSQDTTVHVGMEVELADRTMKLADTFFNPAGGLVNAAALRPLASVFNTPFGNPQVKRIRVNVTAVQARQTALIKGAYFSKSEAEHGERIPLNVVLQPFGKPEQTMTIPIKVPAATDSLRTLSVLVLPGATAPADAAPPDSVGTFLDALQKQHRQTDLVVLVQSPGQGLQYRGRLLKNLPVSAINVLDDFSSRDITGITDVQQIVVPTAWVLSGVAATRVPIREE